MISKLIFNLNKNLNEYWSYWSRALLVMLYIKSLVKYFDVKTYDIDKSKCNSKLEDLLTLFRNNFFMFANSDEF